MTELEQAWNLLYRRSGPAYQLKMRLVADEVGYVWTPPESPSLPEKATKTMQKWIEERGDSQS